MVAIQIIPGSACRCQLTVADTVHLGKGMEYICPSSQALVSRIVLQSIGREVVSRKKCSPALHAGSPLHEISGVAGRKHSHLGREQVAVDASLDCRQFVGQMRRHGQDEEGYKLLSSRHFSCPGATVFTKSKFPLSVHQHGQGRQDFQRGRKLCSAHMRWSEPGGQEAEADMHRQAWGATEDRSSPSSIDLPVGEQAACRRMLDAIWLKPECLGVPGEVEMSRLAAEMLKVESHHVVEESRSSPATAHGKVQPPDATWRLDSRLGGWLLNGVAVGYAATAVIMKALEDPGGGAAAAAPTSLEFFLRFGTAAVSVGLALLLRQTWRERQQRALAGSPGPPPQEGRLEAAPGSVVGPGMELGVWMFMTYAGQAMGLETSSADHATLLLTLSVVLVPFLEASGGRAMTRSVWIATALACLGMMLLEMEHTLGGGAQGLGGGLPSGHLWCLAGAAGSAIHVVRSEILCARSDPMGLVAVQLATAAALSLPWMAWDLAHAAAGLGAFSGALGSVPWPMIFLAGPLGTGLCEWLELEALRFVDAATATLILTASPLWGSLMAYAFLGETLDGSSLLGGGLILLASLQVQLAGAWERRQHGGAGHTRTAEGGPVAQASDELSGRNARRQPEKMAVVHVTEERHAILGSRRGHGVGGDEGRSTRLRLLSHHNKLEVSERTGRQEDVRWRKRIRSLELLGRLTTGLIRR